MCWGREHCLSWIVDTEYTEGVEVLRDCVVRVSVYNIDILTLDGFHEGSMMHANFSLQSLRSRCRL